jgi:DNA-directed RNA polymerase specialized sigma24 family protein
LVDEKKITAWLTTVIWNEYLLILKHEPKDVNPKDKPDEIFEDLLEQLKIRLTSTERVWIKAYIKEGSYTSISERTGIHRNYIAERIKFIIEKCKTLKHTL